MIAFFEKANENRFSIKNLVLSVAFSKGFLLKGQKLFFLGMKGKLNIFTINFYCPLNKK